MEGKDNPAYDEGSDRAAEAAENDAEKTNGDEGPIQPEMDSILFNSQPRASELPESTLTETIDMPDQKPEAAAEIPSKQKSDSSEEQSEDPNKSYGTFPPADEVDFFPASATNQFEFLSNTNPTKGQRKSKTKTTDDSLEDESSSDYTDDLTQWKDRTQAAATTSLSLVQVALLRDVINGGEDTYRHYVATVTILAICIALEIVSGFLIIALYMLKFRAQALTNLDSVRVQDKQGQDEPDAVAEVDGGMEENFTSSGRIARNIYGLDLACCGCYKPGIEEVLREAIRRKYLQELRLTLRYPNYNDLEDVRDDLDLLRKRRRIMQRFLTQVKMNASSRIIIRLQSSITFIFYILSLFNIFVVIFGVSRENRQNQ